MTNCTCPSSDCPKIEDHRESLKRMEERRLEQVRQAERDATDPRTFLKRAFSAHNGMRGGKCMGCGVTFTSDPEILKNWHKTALAYHEHLMDVLFAHPKIEARVDDIVRVHEAAAWSEGYEAGYGYCHYLQTGEGPKDEPANPYVEET